MKIKTADLTRAALNWAAAKCEGWIDNNNQQTYDALLMDINKETYLPSIDWSQGGPIIEQEKISISFAGIPKDVQWRAEHYDTGVAAYGPTPLIAAMRCYVASKLGDEVDIPKEIA